MILNMEDPTVVEYVSPKDYCDIVKLRHVTVKQQLESEGSR